MCPQGRYSTMTGATSCSSCSADSTTTSTGSAAASECSETLILSPRITDSFCLSLSPVFLPVALSFSCQKTTRKHTHTYTHTHTHTHTLSCHWRVTILAVGVSRHVFSQRNLFQTFSQASNSRLFCLLGTVERIEQTSTIYEGCTCKTRILLLCATLLNTGDGNRTDPTKYIRSVYVDLLVVVVCDSRGKNSCCFLSLLYLFVRALDLWLQ